MVFVNMGRQSAITQRERAVDRNWDLRRSIIRNPRWFMLLTLARVAACVGVKGGGGSELTGML